MNNRMVFLYGYWRYVEMPTPLERVGLGHTPKQAYQVYQSLLRFERKWTDVFNVPIGTMVEINTCQTAHSPKLCIKVKVARYGYCLKHPYIPKPVFFKSVHDLLVHLCVWLIDTPTYVTLQIPYLADIGSPPF